MIGWAGYRKLMKKNKENISIKAWVFLPANYYFFFKVLQKEQKVKKHLSCLENVKKL